MANSSLSFTILILFFTCIVCISECSPPPNFVEDSCRAARFPNVCIQSLSARSHLIGNDQWALARAILKATRDTTGVASLSIKNMNVAGLRPVKDCTDQTNNAAYRLTLSMDEFEKMVAASGTEYLSHKSNVLTWVSSAMSSMVSCIDGLDGPAGSAVSPQVKTQMKAMVGKANQLTSNTLFFINKLVKN